MSGNKNSGCKKGIKRTRKFKTQKCCCCKKEIWVMSLTDTVKCWDCRVIEIRDYRKERNAQALLYDNAI